MRQPSWRTPAIATLAIATLAIATLAVALGTTSLRTAPAHAQAGGEAGLEMSGISGDVRKPRRHFRLRHPADLDAEEAAAIYDIVAGALEGGYQRSGHAAAAAYRGWRRYNTAPYLSATHGNHYINNYANETARAYGRFEAAGTLPVGSVVAKDSFAVTQGGEIVLGPLFLMEKMPKGFSYVTDDWRYTMIMPDGSLFGVTGGEDAERVEYCIDCHLAAERHDHLYFIPKAYRVTDQPE